MTWQKQDLATPIPKAIEDVVAPINDLISVILPILSTVQTLLTAAQVFFATYADPYVTLVGSLISQIEAVINDLFGAGAYSLVVTPFSFEVSVAQSKVIAETYNTEINNANIAYEKALLKASEIKNAADRKAARESAKQSLNTNRTKAYNKKNRARSFDQVTGLPILSANDAILAAIESFDDKGDAARPQFSNSANVCAFGILFTVPTIQQLIDILEAMSDVFKIPEFEFALKKIKRFKTTAQVSVNPDWQSVRLNSIEHLSAMQKELLGLLETFRGYLVVPSAGLGDIINILQQKTAKIQQLLTRLQALLNAISRVSGVYFLDVPEGPGGNARIKRALEDPFLQDPCNQTGFTVMALFVGGGPSLQPIETIRALLAES